MNGDACTDREIEMPTKPVRGHLKILTGDDYGEEHARVEAWLDEHPEFVHNYFIRKATRHIIDSWLVAHSHPPSITTTFIGQTQDNSLVNVAPSRPSSGSTTPVRKISAHEFERGGLLKPMVTTIDGTPTFLSPTGGGGIGIGMGSIGGGGGGTNAGVGSSMNGIDSSSSSGSLSSTTPRINRRKSRLELKSLDEKELIFELVKDVYNDLEVRTLCHKILKNVSVLTNADRCSLFLVQGDQCPPPPSGHLSNGFGNLSKLTLDKDGRILVSSLFDVRPDSTVEEIEKKEEIRIPWGTGIVGFVAQTGEPVNIPDAYEDSRFTPEIDQKTGYKTRSILCLPIKDSIGDVIGVAQVINKMAGECEQRFTAGDEKVFSSYLQFCGIAIRNAQLYEQSQLENKRNQVLLDLARVIFEEQSTIEHVVYRIMTHTQSLLQCQRCQVMLVHEDYNGTFSRVFDLDSRDLEAEESLTRVSPFEGRFPINSGITGYVARTGEIVNIQDAYADHRFDPEVDHNFTTKSILSMPIKNAKNQIVGVIQLTNKLNEKPFTKNDENFLEAFAIFCGMGIHNTQMFEQVVRSMAKQRVTLEVLSYHASAPLEDAQKFNLRPVPSAKAYRLHDFKFDDFTLKDDDTLLACLRMFLDLDFVGRFHIDYSTLCRWLLSVRKNYRHVKYHNWRHAFNVAQTYFAIITATQWWRILGDLECLALLIACLCHDLDHRGTNNSFQIKASSPLAELYSTSTMEHHHFDQCIMILNSQGNQILCNLSPDEYTRVINVLEHAILSTDLAVYFRKRSSFFSLVNEKRVSYEWRSEDHKKLLRGMLMTACDISAITKPWEIQKIVAELVASEFFEQGDIEKEKLNITPIDMMNRDKKDQLPTMQVGFIDTICLPVYESLTTLSDKLRPLLAGLQVNRDHWKKLADERNRKEGDN